MPAWDKAGTSFFLGEVFGGLLCLFLGSALCFALSATCSLMLCWDKCRAGKMQYAALPPACLQMHSALLRWLTGDAGASISATNHPLPVIHGEEDMRVNEQSGAQTADGKNRRGARVLSFL